MRNINKVIIIGNLTRDPELKQTQNGQSVATFGIATNREWMSNGEKKKSTEFHECTAWARLAEICNQHLRKGKLIYVEGYLKTRSWEGENGEKRFRTEIVLQDMIMLEKRPKDDFAESAGSGEADGAAEAGGNLPAEEEAPLDEGNMF